MLVGVEAAKELYANQRFHTLPREPPASWVEDLEKLWGSNFRWPGVLPSGKHTKSYGKIHYFIAG